MLEIGIPLPLPQDPQVLLSVHVRDKAWPPEMETFFWPLSVLVYRILAVLEFLMVAVDDDAESSFLK